MDNLMSFENSAYPDSPFLNETLLESFAPNDQQDINRSYEQTFLQDDLLPELKEEEVDAEEHLDELYEFEDEDDVMVEMELTTGEEHFAEVYSEDYSSPNFQSQVLAYDELQINRANNGISKIAKQASKQWKGRIRAEKYRNTVFGLVVHTTGAGLIKMIANSGRSAMEVAIETYTRGKKIKGCHYINGWGGIFDDELVQIGNEKFIGAGVGMGKQIESINRGRFAKDLPPGLVRKWKERWPGKRDSLDLLPSRKSGVNSIYVHVECLPLFYYPNKRKTNYPNLPPLDLGPNDPYDHFFTAKQYDTIALLACDIAIRNGWDLDSEWWRTSRLLGHEDLSPVTRKNKKGGWDPGALYNPPRFHWEYVYDRIKNIAKKGYRKVRYFSSNSAFKGINPGPTASNQKVSAPISPIQTSHTPFKIKWSRTIKRNRYWSRRLGWKAYINRINQILLPYTRTSNASLDEKDFAIGVAGWQNANGFRGNQIDGVLGPYTWRKMKPSLA